MLNFLNLFLQVPIQNLSHSILECSCDLQGVKANTTCHHETGDCECKGKHVTGQQCEKCSPGYYNFPSCECKYN